MVLGVFVDKIEVDLSVEMAEAMAVRGGILLAMDKRVRKLIVEVDSQIVFYALNQPRMDLSYFGRIINNILEDYKCFDEISFSWVRHTANTMAHYISQIVFSCDGPFYSTFIPDGIAFTVNVDAGFRHL
ncbi:hypothetical protein ACS0TY_021088 [Phlomoides rotata]